MKNLACVRGMRIMHRVKGMPRYQGMPYILILECCGYDIREFAPTRNRTNGLRFAFSRCALQTVLLNNIITELNNSNFDFLITFYENHSVNISTPYRAEIPSASSLESTERNSSSDSAYYQNGPKLCEITIFRLPHTKQP